LQRVPSGKVKRIWLSKMQDFSTMWLKVTAK
jgi:hypothetical protein